LIAQSGPILVPGHIIITYRELEAPHQQMLFVYALNSFASLWRPTRGMSIWDRVFGRDLSPLASERLPVGFCLSVILSARESPVRSNTYKILLHILDLVPAPPPPRSFMTSIREKLGARPPPSDAQRERALLFSWNLDTSQSAWRAISTVRADIWHRFCRGTSFSGYSLFNGYNVIDVLKERDGVEAGDMSRVVVPHQEQCTDMYLAPHSCAVVSLTSDSAIVSYYV
jgi:hypothetical protein